jgi:hypothetical protein
MLEAARPWQVSRRIVCFFFSRRIETEILSAAPQVLFELGRHFGNSHSGRHHAKLSSSMFYFVQKEQPCLSRFDKMDTPHVHIIKQADKDFRGAK